MAPRKPGTGGNRFTPQRKEIYLAELRRTGLKIDARLAANVSDHTATRHRKIDAEFCEAEFNALVAHSQMIDDEFRRRGITGTKKLVTIAGEKEEITEWSDRLFLAYAQRHIPAYRPQVKVEQEVTGSIAIGLEDLSKLTRRGRELMRELMDEPLAEEDTTTG